MRNNRNKSSYSEPYTLASPPRGRSSHERSVLAMTDNKENGEFYYKQKSKMRHSPSLLSLRSLASLRRSPTMDQVPAISQPMLDDTSREKVRNKIKHSPSMLSINNISGESELHTIQQKRLVDDLLSYCPTGRIERDFEARLLKNYSHVINLSHNYASQALQSVRIHETLGARPDVPGFTAYEEVHLLTTSESDSGELFCAMNFPDVGVSLDRFVFSSQQETITILLKVAQVLAQAESVFEFEHRNLHAGNIMIDRDPSNGEIARVTLVNCDLARLTDPVSGTVYFTPLDRSDFYKARLPVLALMRVKVANPRAFVPATNVLWLVYLVKYLNSRMPSASLKRAEDCLSPTWGGLRKAPRSAQEAYDRLVRRL